jgi:hypothetical protein
MSDPQDEGQTMDNRLRQFGQFLLTVAVLVAMFAAPSAAQESAAGEKTKAGDELSVDQARLADRFERLEIVLARLAELSSSTDPRRAKLLREAISRSREQGLDGRFESIVTLLEDERLSAASGRQSVLQKELDELLSLLLKADRDRELDSQRKRIKAYLKEVGRIIRLEKGLQARTEGGDDTSLLAEDQQEVGDQTGALGKSISDNERSKSDDTAGKPKDDESQDSDKKPGGDANKGESKEGKPSDDKPSDGKKSDGKPSDGKPSESKSSDGKSADGKPSDGKPGESSDSPPSDSSPSDSSESQPSESGSPSDSTPSPGGKPSSQPSQPGQPGESGESSPSDDQQQQSQEPTDRAAERLKAAQEQMEKAKKQLEESKREGAVESQREALKQLEQAKAELERVLRQLREEELERTLQMLAARFKKMLDAQTNIYEGTVRLDKTAEADRDHDDEIESARLSREESLLVREADRALVLLKEEGSSLAFPETVSLMRDDMQQVTTRLAATNVGKLTQQLEQDIIEALEETIAALDKAIKDLEKQKTPPGQSPPPGQPSEPPLVDKLAELKMIRALQMRINRRTLRYDELLDGEPAETNEVIEALQKLSERQQRVYQATSDLARGRND